ncbi:hypothetical protein ARMSODRAFT_614416 [Armillaria solidipes]|uniref:Uncharacterized protein n=1 Tax=Armillaria solidipes TaxID=1076256 RepID=A0A2H3B4T8_9AGAR|nr:hypothetical protein ARMSODRAFT_614416 [Armillaria solidipes]
MCSSLITMVLWSSSLVPRPPGQRTQGRSRSGKLTRWCLYCRAVQTNVLTQPAPSFLNPIFQPIYPELSANAVVVLKQAPSPFDVTMGSCLRVDEKVLDDMTNTLPLCNPIARIDIVESSELHR